MAIRSLLLSVTVLFLCIGARGEEIVLKAGTKIVGRMVAIKGDTIEIQTPHGKIKVNRSEIVTISFSEDKPDPVPAAVPIANKAPVVDQSLEGTHYTNRTGNFTLALPEGWKISETLRSKTDALAAFTSRDASLGGSVTQEAFEGSIEGFKGLVELLLKSSLDDVETVNESEIKVDGKPGLVFICRGTARNPAKTPLKYLIAIIQEKGRMTRITCFTIEPLFVDAQVAFEKLIQSYTSTQQ